MMQQLQIWRESLGGIDCETCGFSFDEVEITRTAGEALFNVQASLGCYGGAYGDDLTLDELLAWLDRELGNLEEFQQVRKALRQDLHENQPHSVEDIPDDEAVAEAEDETVDPELEAKWDAEVRLLQGMGYSSAEALSKVASNNRAASDKLP